MSEQVMLSCGHVANARHEGAHDGLPPHHPSCAIHNVCTVVGKPDLTGRMAVCAYRQGGRYAGPDHGTPVPSDWDLAFFEYRGPGSPMADEMCVCGYYRQAHERQEILGNRPSIVEEGKCSGFRPHGPWETDEFYDGCFGWD